MAEPVRAAPMPPPSVRATGRLPGDRSPALGLGALLLAPVVVALTLLAPAAIGLLRLRLTDVQLVSTLFLGEAAGMGLVLVLGFAAALTGRGRPFGVVAMVVALLVNPFTLSLVLWLVRQLAPQG